MLTNDSHPTCGVLYIDDEEKALKYFRLAFADKFTIFTAPSGKVGLEILRREAGKIGIVISDQRMPEMLGAEFLGLVREEFPMLVRILTTAYSDLDSAIQAVNQGHIYQYVVKPAEIPELRLVLQRAADYYQVLSERNELLALKMTTLQRIICSDRLRWLLLASRGWDETAQVALRRVLIALVKALPDTPPVLLTGREKFRASHFEIGALIRDEYHNASQCLDAIDKVREGNKEWRRLAATERLNAFAAALMEKYAFGSDQIELMVPDETAANVDLRLCPKAGAFPTGDFSRILFGILLDRETPTLSMLLFETLFAFAIINVSLTISVAPASPDAEALSIVFSFPQDSPSPQDAIDQLAGKFDSWNISRL